MRSAMAVRCTYIGQGTQVALGGRFGVLHVSSVSNLADDVEVDGSDSKYLKAHWA